MVLVSSTVLQLVDLDCIKQMNLYKSAHIKIWKRVYQMYFLFIYFLVF